MKAEVYFKRSASQRITDAKGKFSTQFMSVDMNQNLLRKKALEESVRMGGYEASVKNLATNRTVTQQPMARYSEFWIG